MLTGKELRWAYVGAADDAGPDRPGRRSRRIAAPLAPLTRARRALPANAEPAVSDPPRSARFTFRVRLFPPPPRRPSPDRSTGRLSALPVLRRLATAKTDEPGVSANSLDGADPAAAAGVSDPPEAAVGRRRRFDPLTVCVVVATAVFALAGIGSPLLGLKVFADTESLATYSGYRDVLNGVTVQTQYQRDLVDAQMPNAMLFGDAARAGTFAAWDPYPLGGGPLGSTPNFAVASPLSAPFWLLPGWLAPAYVKLLELICAIGGMYLFLRRLRLGKPAAWLGGLVFAGSAFMVVWTGWPQTRVAALIPALFWAAEGVVARPRLREIALLSLPVAGMLLGGFPAVTGYALVTAGIYVVGRLLAQEGRAWPRHWPRIVTGIAAATAGLIAGIGLVAWQLVPWLQYMPTVHLADRTQDLTQIIPASALLTTIAPYAFGTVNPAQPPNYFGGLELIDAESYLGAAALVLVVTAIALAGRARALLPRGAWWLVVSGAALWTVVIYLGGPPLWLLQHTSFLFADNFIGRARSVLGFLLAVLAAVGFEVVRRRRPEHVTTRRQWYGYSVWGALVAAGIALYVLGRRVAATAQPKRTGGGADALSFLTARLAVGVAIMLVAGAAVAWLWWGRPRTGRWRWLRPAAAGLLPLLIAGQSLAWVANYYPRTDRDTFYPANPTQAYLAAHLGHERYYGADGAIFGSVDVTAELRSLHGHGLLDQRVAELAQALPGEQFAIPPTAIVSPPVAGAAARSPVLDRAAVDYYVVPPQVRPFGSMASESINGPPVTLRPGQSITATLPAAGPVRGVGLVLDAAGDTRPMAARVSVTDAAHRELVSGARTDPAAATGQPWIVALAGEQIAPGTPLTATVTITGIDPVRLATHNGRPALAAVVPAPDGLRLVYAAESVIYQRTTALARARWASATQVVADPAKRVALLASGRLNPDEVILDAAGPPAQGRPATVTWVADGLQQFVLDVQAQGAGYLVLADAIQTGWRVSVDGADATLVPADHAFAAVPLSAGHHTVRFYYPQPWAGPGVWITGATVLGLLACLLVAGWRRRRAWSTLAGSDDSGASWSPQGGDEPARRHPA